MYPSWITMNELISVTRLDESVIKTWFKNQRVKRRKQQRPTQPSPSLEAPYKTASVKEEDSPSAEMSANTSPTSLSISDHCDRESPEPSGIEQPRRVGASGGNSSGDPQPSDLQQICLGVSDAPWASIPYDIDQFIQAYALPVDDDPCGLDQYLLPKPPGWRGRAGTDLQCDG
ncbi:paired-like homeodomain transcription factor LEUTX [Manis javanica]|uniref:paired-like homeodomain transcription factor LEUTX n=1 Tax=Manis javanica TaxID=9974 RepID=UPI00187AC437|nr:paired-like homeodomain transcription factor LEUTX [Manis javanica]